MRHDRFIQRAVEIAQTSEHEKWWLGSIAVKGSRVLAYSPNKFRNPPWINHLQSTRHAEMATLARCILPEPEAVLFI